MAFCLNFGSLPVHIGVVPEQREAPPCLGADHEEILDQIDAAKLEIRKAGNMVDAWGDFTAELAGIDTPETVLALVERLRPSLENWASSHLGALTATLADLEEQEAEIGQPWK
jgi:hypothetical protein